MELHDSDEDVLFLYSFKIESVEFFFKRVAITSLNFHFSTTERMASLRSTHKKRYPIKIKEIDVYSSRSTCLFRNNAHRRRSLCWGLSLCSLE